MNKAIFTITGVAALLLTGCWTFNETPFPEVAVASAENSAKTNTIALTGFEALLTEYEAINGFQTVYVPGYCGRHHYHPGYIETVPVTTYIPQKRSTDMFLKRAQDSLEKAGFTLAVANAGYIVDVAFTGPIRDSADEIKQFCWMLGTIFFCDYEAVSWTAKLRIRDAKSGRLVFHHDYLQRYETNVFGLIPLFSAPTCRQTQPPNTQSWCLAALTDRAIADAAAYLSSIK